MNLNKNNIEIMVGNYSFIFLISGPPIGPSFKIKTILPGMGNPIKNIRRFQNYLIFVREYLYF